MNNYRGWNIGYAPSAPITGRWRASQHGVSVNAHTEEALKRVIDLHIEDRAAYIKGKR